MIVCELSRIASHLVAAGCYGLDLGSFTPFMWTFREREKILHLFEELCGARLTYSYITPGGVTADLPPGWLQQLRGVPDEFEPVIDELHAPLTSNAIFIRRTAGIGVLAPEMAIDYGCTGPVLRGSGVDWDLRRDGEPLCTRMYEGYKFEVIAQVNGQYPHDYPYPPVPPEAVLGDCWHRFYVRMLEVVQSMYLVRQAMEKYSQTHGSVGRADQAEAEAPQGRGLPGDRGPQGPDGLHAHRRRHAGAVAGADPQQQFLQPFGRAGIVPRLPDGRRAGDRRLVGFGVGRDRSVGKDFRVQSLDHEIWRLPVRFETGCATWLKRDRWLNEFAASTG